MLYQLSYSRKCATSVGLPWYLEAVPDGSV